MPSVAARRVYLPPGSPRRVVPRWVGPLVACGVLLAGASIFGSAYWEGYQLRREAAALVREREDIRRRNAQLREEIRLLNTPEYVERLAREQLGLVKPGELAIILVQPTPVPSPASPREAGRREERWWTRWLGR